MEPANFEVAFNKEQVQYYEYIRQIIETNELAYWIGNPSVEIVNGTLYMISNPSILSDSGEEGFEGYLEALQKQLFKKESAKRSKTLALMGIPNNKTPIQIYQSLSRFQPQIMETKVIKTTHPKYYAMLLLFKDEISSTSFFNQAFGQQYNGIEIQRIITRQVIQLTLTVTGIPKNQPDLEILPLRKLPQQGEKINCQQIFRKSKTQNKVIPKKTSTSPRKEDSSQSTCVICFEQNEKTLISILCGHVFHWQCLMSWKEDTCPLCRYHQHPPVIKYCEECNQCDGLWVCLLCGVRLCCGFSNSILSADSHIYQHYQLTNHNLSMQLETKFLFDARKPAFLHQMFYKELKQNTNEVMQENNSCKEKTNKFKDKISEYEQIISEEMQEQRQFFEENINKQIKSNRQILNVKKNKILEIETEMKQIEERLEESEMKRDELIKDNDNVEKQHNIIQDYQHRLLKKVESLKTKKELEQKKEMNELDRVSGLIEERKEELNDYRKNIQISDKLKTNLGSEKVSVGIVLGMEKKKKKKKK